MQSKCFHITKEQQPPLSGNRSKKLKKDENFLTLSQTAFDSITKEEKFQPYA
jgi:hypothetical protein